MEIFHKAIGLKPSLPEKVLSQQVALTFLGNGAKEIKSDFLKSEYAVLTLSGDHEIHLAFFFKESRLFSEHLARLLETYLLCQRNADWFTEFLSAASHVRNPDIRILVFVPEKLPIYDDIMKLIAVPLHIITYTSIRNREGEEALLLDEFESSIKSTEVSKSSKEFAIPEIAKEALEVPGREEVSVDVGRTPDLKRQSAQFEEGENFFRRAKLSREEIRALLDLDLELDKIKG